jgi:hypothetical protein
MALQTVALYHNRSGNARGERWIILTSRAPPEPVALWLPSGEKAALRTAENTSTSNGGGNYYTTPGSAGSQALVCVGVPNPVMIDRACDIGQ